MGVVANAAEACGPRHRAQSEGTGGSRRRGARQSRASAHTERRAAERRPSIADGTAEMASGERR